MYKLLNNMRVIEASSFIASPLAGLYLSQMGAEVIRVDQIGGGPDFNRWPKAPNYVTADGKRLMVMAITPRQWSGLVKALDIAEAVASLRSEDMDHARRAQRPDDLARAYQRRGGNGAGFDHTGLDLDCVARGCDLAQSPPLNRAASKIVSATRLSELAKPSLMSAIRFSSKAEGGSPWPTTLKIRSGELRRDTSANSSIVRLSSRRWIEVSTSGSASAMKPGLLPVL